VKRTASVVFEGFSIFHKTCTKALSNETREFSVKDFILDKGHEFVVVYLIETFGYIPF
jgi:hypothetical protein